RREREPPQAESERQCDENCQNCCVFGLSQRIHGSSFLFPRYVDSASYGSGRGEEPSGASVLRLIQIRSTASSLEKIAPACPDNLQRIEPLILVPRTQSASHSAHATK